MVPHSGLPGELLLCVHSETAVTATGAAQAPFWKTGGAAELRLSKGRRSMSAALAMPVVLPAAYAVAEAELPRARPRPIVGLAFYRKHTLGLLRRYLQLSMELSRTRSALDRIVLRGQVSSYRLRTFEDGVIFVLDVEKCIRQLDPVSRKLVTYVVLEDYSLLQAVDLMGRSPRTVARIYGDAMDRLTSFFLQFGLLVPNVEKLSRGEAEIEGNGTT
jgi:hypothetical protein